MLELLQKPTAKENATVEKFRMGGTAVKEYCPQLTKEDCCRYDLHSGWDTHSSLYLNHTHDLSAVHKSSGAVRAVCLGLGIFLVGLL